LWWLLASFLFCLGQCSRIARQQSEGPVVHHLKLPALCPQLQYPVQLPGALFEPLIGS
jgi:hypothetical protein